MDRNELQVLAATMTARSNLVGLRPPWRFLPHEPHRSGFPRQGDSAPHRIDTPRLQRPGLACLCGMPGPGDDDRREAPLQGAAAPGSRCSPRSILLELVELAEQPCEVERLLRRLWRVGFSQIDDHEPPLGELDRVVRIM